MPNGFEGVDYATMKQLFVSSQAAMFAGGSWEIPGFRKAGINFGIMPAPGAWTDSTRLVSSFLDGGYGVNAASKNKEAALKFIRFTATQPFGQMLTDKLANVSTIEGAVSSDPLLAQIAEMHNNATPYIMLVGYRFDKPTGSTMLQNGLQQIYAGTKTPVQVAKDIVDGMKAWDN
jgi:raffinose/stachyose/melibiose transport system substrate-binding protein